MPGWWLASRDKSLHAGSGSTLETWPWRCAIQMAAFTLLYYTYVDLIGWIAQTSLQASEQWSPLLALQSLVWFIFRDQPNSRFHGRDIFREICLLPWKTPIFVKFRDIRDFSRILMLLLSFMTVFRVLSTAFVWMLLFAMCHTSALSSWHVFTVLLTYIPPH